MWTRAPWTTSPGGFFEPKRGYRYKAESPLIRELVGEGAGRVLDLGAGCGVVGLSAALATPDATVTLVERNPTLAEFSRRNLREHQRDGEVLEVDLRALPLGEPYDLIVSNPPYFVPGSGQPSRATMVREATHAHHGDVETFVVTGAQHLAPDGAMWVVFPAESLPRLVLSIARAGLALCEVVVLFARHKEAPFRVWCKAQHTPSRLVVRELSVWTTR